MYWMSPRCRRFDSAAFARLSPYSRLAVSLGAFPNFQSPPRPPIAINSLRRASYPSSELHSQGSVHSNR